MFPRTVWYFAAYCGDEADEYVPAYNTYGVQVPVNQTGVWQPNFQCADFMARALTQNGLVPGLNKGKSTRKRPPRLPLAATIATRPTATPTFSGMLACLAVPDLSNYLLDSKLASNIH